jgi:hypothetical protein
MTVPAAYEMMGWSTGMIGDIRDTIQQWLVDKYKIVDEAHL